MPQPQLQQEIGEPLTPAVLAELLERYGDAVTCLCLMGGDGDPAEGGAPGRRGPHAPPRPPHRMVLGLRRAAAALPCRHPRLREARALRRGTGRPALPTTNQRLYRLESDGSRTDLTGRFTRR